MSDDDKGETNTNLFGCEDDRSLWTRIWQGAAGASLVLNLVAMILAGGGITILSGLVAIAIAPIVIYLQFQLSELDSKCDCPWIHKRYHPDYTTLQLLAMKQWFAYSYPQRCVPFRTN